jgi:hypothetical protein
LALLPNPRLSHAILIGTSEFRGSEDLQDLPAVRNNLADLQASLTNPQHGVLVGENCTIVDNPDSPRDFMERLCKVARQTNDFLLVYYAGHGVRHAKRDDLYLTLRHTETDALNGTAVPLDWVKEEIEHSPARTRLLVLDCCYAGLAVGTMSSAIDQRELEVRGSAVIASSPRNARSHSPAGHRHTAFTGQLVALLDNGSPNVGEQLTVTALYSRVSVALAKGGFPKPMLAVTGTTGELLLRQPVLQINGPAERTADASASSQELHAGSRSVSTGTPSGEPVPTQHAEANLEQPVPQPSPPRSSPELAKHPPVRRDGLFWAQVVLLRFLWVCFALMLAMFLSGLVGVLFGTPPRPGVGSSDGSTAGIGLAMAAAIGAPLFLVNRKWRHLRGRTSFARSIVGRVVLAICGVVCIAFGITALASDSLTETRTGSAAAGRAGVFVIAVEGAAASGFYFYRGRRAPS